MPSAPTRPMRAGPLRIASSGRHPPPHLVLNGCRAFGNRLGPDEATALPAATRWISSTAGKARLARPLDFLVVADHSDNMGFFPDLFAGSPTILADPTGRSGMTMFKRATVWRPPLRSLTRSPWQVSREDHVLAEQQDVSVGLGQDDDAAEKYNEPGRFTAFIGYEWTSQVPPGQNLHRVVIYRDDADKARQTVPRRPMRPRAAPTRKTSGSSSSSMKTRPAERSSLSPTTATCRTA